MTDRLSREETLQLLHDLRGPLLAIDGFSEELAITTDSLFSALQRHEAELPEELVLEFGEMLRGDLAPCLHFLKSAARQLERRLDDLSSDHGAVSGVSFEAITNHHV